MLEPLKRHLEAIVVGPAVRHENLTIYPLFAPPEGPQVVTLVEALRQKTAEVTEVSENGSVPELLVKNHGGLPLLILDGEELVGAKQNRILNTSILVKAGAFVKVPVSCVERGRWNRVSHEFVTHERIMPSSMRSSKSARVTASLKQARGYDADQCTVWTEVAQFERSRGVRSRTGALTDTLVADAVHVDRFVDAIPSQEGQVGLAAYVDGRFLGLDLVGRPEVYASAHKRLLRSYSFEALVTNVRTRHKVKPLSGGSARDFHRHGLTSEDVPSESEFGEPRTIAIPAVQLDLELKDQEAAAAEDAVPVEEEEQAPQTNPIDEDVNPLVLLKETLEGEFTTHASPGSGTDLRLEAAQSQISALWADEGMAHLAVFPAA
jgi:hypothetical protein